MIPPGHQWGLTAPLNFCPSIKKSRERLPAEKYCGTARYRGNAQAEPREASRSAVRAELLTKRNYDNSRPAPSVFSPAILLVSAQPRGTAEKLEATRARESEGSGRIVGIYREHSPHPQKCTCFAREIEPADSAQVDEHVHFHTHPAIKRVGRMWLFSYIAAAIIIICAALKYRPRGAAAARKWHCL